MANKRTFKNKKDLLNWIKQYFTESHPILKCIMTKSEIRNTEYFVKKGIVQKEYGRFGVSFTKYYYDRGLDKSLLCQPCVFEFIKSDSWNVGIKINCGASLQAEKSRLI